MQGEESVDALFERCHHKRDELALLVSGSVRLKMLSGVRVTALGTDAVAVFELEALWLGSVLAAASPLGIALGAVSPLGIALCFH